MSFQGYVAEIPISAGDKRCKEYLVCTSCARAMRGRYKIQKLQTNVICNNKVKHYFISGLVDNVFNYF
jgi:hypothetical protein